MKRFFPALLLFLALLLCIRLVWAGILNESRSIGVIGGADGPVAIFVAGPDHHNHKS